MVKFFDRPGHCSQRFKTATTPLLEGSMYRVEVEGLCDARLYINTP